MLAPRNIRISQEHAYSWEHQLLPGTYVVLGVSKSVMFLAPSVDLVAQRGVNRQIFCVRGEASSDGYLHTFLDLSLPLLVHLPEAVLVHGFKNSKISTTALAVLVSLSVFARSL